jgi:hypothetical protein
MDEKQAKPNLTGPFYTGMYLHNDDAGGYTITVPTDWHKIPLKTGMVGMMFSPYADDINTSLLTQKNILKYKVNAEDMPLLREGFEKGIRALPGVEIDKIEASYSKTINVFDAVFSFLDGDVRRKRWVRNVYWAEGQLIIIAQGRTPEDYEYWLPMFFNIITTCDIH